MIALDSIRCSAFLHWPKVEQYSASEKQGFNELDIGTTESAIDCKEYSPQSDGTRQNSRFTVINIFPLALEFASTVTSASYCPLNDRLKVKGQ